MTEDFEKGAMDLGDGVTADFFCWKPDRELNPQWNGVADIERAGLLVFHPRPDNGKACTGAIHFDLLEVARVFPDEKHRWRVESWEPLTISPSILCMRCGAHGFIRAGRWVRA